LCGISIKESFLFQIIYQFYAIPLYRLFLRPASSVA
jgi:hypothetical protein